MSRKLDDFLRQSELTFGTRLLYIANPFHGQAPGDPVVEVQAGAGDRMGFVQSLRDRLFGRQRARERDGEELYRAMRSRLLTVPASEVNLSPTAEYPVIWAGLMDWHVGSGVATLVAVADGTVSLYLSSGGGVIGVGTHQDVMAVARRFLGALASHAETLGRQDNPPLPGPNGVRFVTRTYDATLASAEIATDELGEGRHALSPVFDVAQELIAVIREAAARPRT